MLSTSSNGPASSVETAFRPAFEEISRRAKVARSWADEVEAEEETAGPTYFETSADATRLPFEVPGQELFLVSMGTAVLAPRPVDMARPALRVYGGFETREDALDHAQTVSALDPECSLILVRRNKWVLMPATEAARDDPQEAERRLEKRLAAHREVRAAECAEFTRAVREHVDRPAPRDLPEEEDRETQEAEALVYKPPRRLRAGGEVRGQAVAALCLLPDPLGGECLLKVLGCFENTAEADNWVRNVASRHETEHDIVVTPTCEWCYPNGGTQKSSRQHYRVGEMQRIMDAAERNPEGVRQYKEWKREQDERKLVEEEEDPMEE